MWVIREAFCRVIEERNIKRIKKMR